jgi:hypothetical protein
MRTLTILFLFTISNLALAKDPCAQDNKSNDCLEKVKRSLFIVTGVDGVTRKEEATYLEGYFKKYGIEGFYPPASKHRAGSMLEYALSSSHFVSLNKKLILALPKGQSVEGLNVYALVIGKSPPFTRDSDMKSYVDQLKVLFPDKGNEDFSTTIELFGLPWEDPNFSGEYLKRMQAVIETIDRHNSIFKRTEFLDVKKEMEGLIARVTELSELPNKACEQDNLNDFNKMINKYGDIMKSQSTDVISCLIKKQKYNLVEQIIENAEYDQSKLPGYFDQVAAIKTSPESFKLGQSLYLRMAQEGLKINSVKGEKHRDLLQRGSVYLNKYDQEDIICDLQSHNGTTIGDLSTDLSKTLYVQAYQLMERILAEKDASKKEALIEQFSQLKEVGVSLGQLHPTSGKTIMHMIAEVGALDVVNALVKKKISLESIGHEVADKSSNKPFDVAVELATVNTLKLAQFLYKNTYHSGYYEIKEIRKQVKKIKTKDDEVKAQKKVLIDTISSEMSHTY